MRFAGVLAAPLVLLVASSMRLVKFAVVLVNAATSVGSPARQQLGGSSHSRQVMSAGTVAGSL